MDYICYLGFLKSYSVVPCSLEILQSVNTGSVTDVWRLARIWDWEQCAAWRHIWRFLIWLRLDRRGGGGGGGFPPPKKIRNLLFFSSSSSITTIYCCFLEWHREVGHREGRAGNEDGSRSRKDGEQHRGYASHTPRCCDFTGKYFNSSQDESRF